MVLISTSNLCRRWMEATVERSTIIRCCRHHVPHLHSCIQRDCRDVLLCPTAVDPTSPMEWRTGVGLRWPVRRWSSDALTTAVLRPHHATSSTVQPDQRRRQAAGLWSGVAKQRTMLVPTYWVGDCRVRCCGWTADGWQFTRCYNLTAASSLYCVNYCFKLNFYRKIWRFEPDTECLTKMRVTEKRGLF